MRTLDAGVLILVSFGPPGLCLVLRGRLERSTRRLLRFGARIAPYLNIRTEEPAAYLAAGILTNLFVAPAVVMGMSLVIREDYPDILTVLFTLGFGFCFVATLAVNYRFARRLAKNADDQPKVVGGSGSLNRGRTNPKHDRQRLH